jgi:hypothetical protein
MGLRVKTIQATVITGSKPWRQNPFSLLCRNGPPTTPGFAQQLKFQRRSYLPGKARTIYAYGELKTRMLQFCSFGILRNRTSPARRDGALSHYHHLTATTSSAFAPTLDWTHDRRRLGTTSLATKMCKGLSSYGVHTISAGAARTNHCCLP